MTLQQATASNAQIYTNLYTLLVRVETQIQTIDEYDEVLPTFDQEYAPKGKIYAALAVDNSIPTFTNLSVDNLLDIYQSMQLFIVDARVQSPKCKSSILDQLVCYLIWSKLEVEYDKLGRQFKIKPNRMKANIDCIRPLLNKTLWFHW
jgi:hypothetical protein